jgi:hypothetical protein
MAKEKSVKSKIIHSNLNGFNHEKVYKNMEGDLTYLCDIKRDQDASILTVYKVKYPNITKGYKNFVGLYSSGGLVYITGFNDLDYKDRYVTGVSCNLCNTVVYSVYRHHMSFCKCGAFYMDGGRDYNRSNSTNQVVIDLLKNKVLKSWPTKY